MLFNNVIGQVAIKQQLINLNEQNRLSHAILFLGKQGSGALALAIGFAQYLVSSTKKSEKAPLVADLFGGFSALPVVEEASDSPASDLEIDSKALALIHPDLHFSYPVIPKKTTEKPVSTDYVKQWREFYKQTPYGNIYDWLQYINAENKQGNITAEECNDIIRKLSLKAFEAPYKILVLWMPERLGKEGNKLLKLIEEPPPDTLFFLVAEDEAQILPTIVSRCQLIPIPAIQDNEVEKALIEQKGIEQEKARAIALVSEGDFREALQLLESNNENWDNILRDWLNAMFIKSASDLRRFEMQVKSIETLSALGRESQKLLLRYFLKLIEQSLRTRLIGAAHINLLEKEKEFAQKINNMSGVSTQQAMVQELENAIYYIERNANAKMLFHALTIKLRSIVLDKMVLLTS